MRKSLTLVAALLALGTLSSCGTILNPYKNSFKCDPSDTGRCASVQEAYAESIGERPPLAAPEEEQGGSWWGGGAPAPATNQQNAETAYQAQLFKKMAGMLKEPATPGVVPPPVVRVLFLSYPAGEDESLFMFRYAYFFADKPRWVLADPLIREGE